ncbi:MAG: ROK family protein [Terriglobales bacterium]|jgi:glucokinase
MLGAVDIGGTKIAAGAVDEAGHVVAKNECSTEANRGFDDAMRRVASLLRQSAEKTGGKLQGIGIGCAGPLDSMTGVVGNANNLQGWEGGNPVKILSREFGIPVALENDANAAALGELRWGAGSQESRFLYVTVGTGIGVSVILDGKVYRGSGGYHPEIGHHILDPAGPPCTCGVRGCWESLAAGPAMTAWLKENSPANYTGDLSAGQICARARGSDEWAQRAVERESYYLGLGLANLITIFAPDAIVLGGSVMKSAHLFLDRMHEVIRQNCKLVPVDRVDIRVASLGTDVGLIGAAEVWRNRFETERR